MGTTGNNAREARARTSQSEAAESPEEHLSLEDLGDVPMLMEVLLGGAQMSVRQILNMKAGTVVPLRKLAGEMSEVYVNGMSLARGEIVVIGDNLSVRIAEITGQMEQPD